MRALPSRVLFCLSVLAFAPFVLAHDITLSGTSSFAALDGSASDHDGTANGVFTVSDGDLVVNGTVNCNDDGPGSNSACAMTFAVSGDMTINSGGALYAENRNAGGAGGAITLTVGGNLALNGTAIVSSAAKTSSSGNGGAITANVAGTVTVAAGSTIDSGSAKSRGGTIDISTGNVVSIAGNVLSGPSRTLLATRLTGAVLDGGNPNQSGGEIIIRSTTFVEPAISVSSTATIASQGEKDGAGPVTLDGCGIEVRGLVAAVSTKASAATVVIRSGKSVLVDGRDLGGSGTRMGRVRADALTDGANDDRVDLFASDSVTVLGPASGSLFAVSSIPGGKANKDAGGAIRVVALGSTATASGRAFVAGVDGKGTRGGTVSIAAADDVNLDTATIVATGDYSKPKKQSAGGDILVRSHSGDVLWRNGVGDVRPIGSSADVPPADQGTIVLTACGTIDTSGSSYPANGVPTGVFPETHTGVCSPAAPSLPVGVPPLLTCNTPPVADDTTATTNEDTTVTITLSGSDVDGDSLTFTIVSGPSNGTLGPIVSTGPTTATVDYTPALNFNGNDSFVFRANDGNGGTDDATAFITIIAVNDPPSFQVGPTDVVLEDQGPRTYLNWVTAISPGPADESSQSVTFTVTNDNPSLFSVQPSVAADGTLTYTSAPNAYGTANLTVVAQDDGGTANGGNDTSAPQGSAINVTPVNDEPSFTAGASQTVNEDAGAQSVSGWATAISAGPNESGQSVTFHLSSDNPSLFSAGPAVSPSGTLTYTPAPDANGVANVTIYLQDDAGIANGGDDTSPSQSFTITVNAVNDAPSFTGGGDVTVLEDSAAYSSAWASSISAGPADESGQTLAFRVSNDNNALFATQPSISPSGVLTFTPAANAFGSANVTVTLSDNGGTANGGSDTSAPQSFVLTINAINDEPSFASGGDVAVNEDSGAYAAAWATAISAGPNESGQTVAFFTANDNNTLFAVQPSVSPSGVLTFTPAANAFGSATVTVYLMDDGGTANGGDDTSPTVTFTITVNSVNDAPSFTSGGGVTVVEDSGAYSAAWATSISAGPANESSQTVVFIVTANTNSALFSVQPSVSPSGLLTFTPAANTTGSATVTLHAQDNGGTANGGVDVSGSQSFTITVSDVNDPPSFTPGADQTSLEDAGPQTVSPWATAISAGPGESQNVSFVVSNDNNLLFSVQPSIAPDGTLTYTAAPNASGVATVTVYAQDDGGTANGGDDTSDPVTFTITVLAVNDAPSFTGGGDVTVLEDSGAYSAAWATGISAGPADESGQSLNFTVDSNSNPALFASGPAIAGDGTLTFTAAANAFGSATITITLHDDGGTANGGVDSSAPYTFTITIDGVNDAPSLTSGGNVSVNEDSGPYSATWATAISAGPNESGQSVNFVVSNDNSALFSAQPSVSPAGVLTFTPAANAYGTATVSVYLMDNGGTANGGVDVSPTITFVITVNAVNDPPLVAGESYETIGNTMLEVSAAQTQSPAVFVSGSLLSNDSDIDGPNALTASLASATAGAVVVVNADGTFTYVPPAGFTGANDTFGYNVSDGASSTTGTVTINVKNRVWYVRNNTSGTSGRSHDPFATIAAAESASAAGDTIYIFTGDGSTSGQNAGFVMKTSQRLLGAGVALDVPVSVNGGPNPTVLLAAGTRPSIGNAGGSGVTALNVSGVEIAGVNISASTSGVRITTTGVSSGSANVHDMSVVSASNEGFDIDGGGISGVLGVGVTSVSVTSTGNAFDARTTAGELRVALDGSSISSSGGSGVFLNGGTGTTLVVTSLANNAISGNTAGDGVSATNVRFDAVPGGTLDTVSGGTTTIGSAGNGVGVSGLVLSSTSGHLSFTSLSVVADGIAAVSIAGTGPLTATTGTGLSSAAGSITAAGGSAITASNATLGLSLASLSSANSPLSGFSLTNVSGSLSSSGGSITNAINADVNISGTSASVAYGGTITDDVGQLVNITGSSGSMAFTGAITDGNDGDGSGISLTSNTGGTITFSGGVTLSTGANAAFTATGGGAVNVIDPAGSANNTITTTTGTAVNISSPATIGASGVTFERITVDNGASPGASNAIVLNGTTGNFTVTGDGSQTGGFYDRDGSGGTINRTTGHSVLLTNASNVTLRQMNITNTAANADGVNSSGGSNIVLSAMNFDTLGRHGWSVTDIGGVNRVDHNSRFFGWNAAQSNAVGVNQNVSFTSFTVDRSLFTTSATGADAFLFDGNSGGGTVTVSNSEFTLIDQDAVQINNDGSGTITVLVQSNNFHDADSTGGDGNNTLFMANSGSGILNFTIGGPSVGDGNSFTNLGRLVVAAGVVQVNAATVNQTGTRVVGTIQNNTINGSTGRRGIDIGIEANGGAHGGHDITIANNSVSNVRRQGVNVLLTSVNGGDVTGNDFRITSNVLTNVGQEGNTDSGSGIEFENNTASAGGNFSSDVLIQNNQVSNNSGSGLGSTLEVNNRSLFAGDSNLVNLTIWGNSLTNANPLGEVLEILNTGVGGTQTLCLDMNGANVPANANSYTGGGAAGFKLTNNYGTYNIAFMGAGPQTFAAVQTFLSPRNNNQTVTAAGAVGNMSGSTGGCTLP